MCGLVGVVSKRTNGFSREQQEIFSNLLFIDMLRGDDSTGVMVVANDGDVYVAKDEGGPLRFMNTKEYDDAMQKAWNRGAAMIGHNRKATRGTVNDTNAHPFNVDDNIILVHNGTMHGDHKKHADVEVDSHAIAHLIHEKGNVAEALSAFSGAYALIWYDVAKGELNMIRNNDRPLWWMETDDAWIWSSEKAMLEFVAAPTRLDLKIKTQPTSLPPDLHQKFTLTRRGWEVSSDKVEIKKPVYTSSGTGSAAGGDWYEEYAAGMYGWESNRELGGAHDQPPFPTTPASNVSTPKHPMHGPTNYPDERAGVSTRGDNMGSTGAQSRATDVIPRQSETKKPKDGPTNISLREPPEWANLKQREQSMARRLNKIINYKEYRDVLLNGYTYNTYLHVSPFDYEAVNGKDGNDGWYLYANPFDDSDVIVRQFFSANIPEERMIQLAGCDYVFEFLLNVRSWAPFDGELAKRQGRVEDDTQGYCIIRSSQCKMISAGMDRHEKTKH